MCPRISPWDNKSFPALQKLKQAVSSGLFLMGKKKKTQTDYSGPERTKKVHTHVLSPKWKPILRRNGIKKQHSVPTNAWIFYLGRAVQFFKDCIPKLALSSSNTTIF